MMNLGEVANRAPPGIWRRTAPRGPLAFANRDFVFHQ
jgi:hypothetical protein